VTRRVSPLQAGIDRGYLGAFVAFALLVGVWASGVDVVAWGLRLAALGDPLVASLDPPPRREQPVHVLAVGSDSRSDVVGLEGSYGSLSGGRADVLMLLRVGPAGIDAVNLPRDLRVTTEAGDGALATVLEVPGPPELVRTVRELTNVAVHHYVEVEFAQAAAMVDVMGGIEVTHEHRLRDTTAGLELPAGRLELSGDAAVAYLRSRRPEAFVDGAWVPLRWGDLARVERQQRLLADALRSLRQRPAEEVAAVAARVRRVDVRTSTLTWQTWPRLIRWVLSSEARICTATLSVEPLRDPEARRSPFAPGHLGARHWLIPVTVPAVEDPWSLVGDVNDPVCRR
jgi:LCP family protein required for cell wall assembly